MKRRMFFEKSLPIEKFVRMRKVCHIKKHVPKKSGSFGSGAFTGGGVSESRALSGEGVSGSRTLAGGGISGSRTFTGGVSGSRTLSGGGISGSRTLSRERVSGSRTLSGGGIFRSGKLLGGDISGSGMLTGEGVSESRTLSGEGVSGSRTLSRERVSGSRTLSGGRISESRRLTGGGVSGSRTFSGDVFWKEDVSKRGKPEKCAFERKYAAGRWRAAGMLVILCMSVFASGCGKAAEWEKHIMEESVYVEGLQKEYTLLFLTDTHVIIPNENASPEEAENEKVRTPIFTREGEAAPAEQFAEWVRYANETGVDAVLLGGDIIDTPSASNLEWLGEQLAKLEMPYLYVVGNHDWTFPWEYMTQTAKETYLPLLKPFMDENTAIHSLDLGEIILVGIDDSSNQVAEEVFPAYEEILREGRPAVVIAHVPFMTQSVLGRARDVWKNPVVIGAGNYGGIYPNETSEKFVSLTTASDSPVELVLAGHVHFYDKDVIEGERDVLQLAGGPGFQGEALLIRLTGSKEAAER